MDTTTLTAVIAAGATVLGGIGVELIRKLLSRSSEKEDHDTVVRQELRGEITELKANLAAAQESVSKWQTMYYEVKAKEIDILEDLSEANNKLERIAMGLPPVADEQRAPPV